MADRAGRVADKAWLVPVALAATAFVLAYLFLPGPEEGPLPDLLLPFHEARAAPGEEIRFLGVWEQPVGHRHRALLADAVLLPDGTTRAPLRPSSWLAVVPVRLPSDADAPVTAHVPGAGLVVAPAAGPRLGHDGWTGIQGTAYVFTADGLLVATNAPPEERDRFRLHEHHAHLGHAVWHVGEGPAPPGMSSPPALVPRAVVEALHGLPEGGVRTLVVREGAAAHLLGDLHAVVRADQLVRE